jgi:hypothetical protein
MFRLCLGGELVRAADPPENIVTVAAVQGPVALHYPDPLPGQTSCNPSGHLCCGAAAHPVTRPIDQFRAVAHPEHHRGTYEHNGGSKRNRSSAGSHIP